MLFISIQNLAAPSDDERAQIATMVTDLCKRLTGETPTHQFQDQATHAASTSVAVIVQINGVVAGLNKLQSRIGDGLRDLGVMQEIKFV